MDLNTTKEDMLERFKLYGEIYCMLAEIEEDNYTMDYFKLEGWEIEELLENEKVNLIFDFGDEKGELYELNFEEDMLMVFYTSNKDEVTKGYPIIHIPTNTIRKLKDLLEKYVEALKEEGV